MNDEAERVAGLIEAYLARHPAAADSERGIAQWWLQSMGADVPVEVVRQALDLLVRRGTVVRTDVPGGPALYRKAGQRP